MPDQKKPDSGANNPISVVPHALPITSTKEQPELPKHAPQFAPVKHPVLFAIHGKKHVKQSLKDLIDADPNLQEPYKALLHHELSFVETDAAEIDLHVVKHQNGDVSFQGHIKRIPLG